MRIQDLFSSVVKALARTFRDPTSSDEEEPQPDWLQPIADPNCLGTLDHYRVMKRLGGGGMGAVYLAEDPARGRRVAIKVLRPELADHPRLRRAFLREGRIAMSVHHPNVVATHAVHRNPGGPYVVSDYMAGGSLQQRIERDGPLDVFTVCDYGIQISRGLQAIHQKGLVHSDIKPLNILLDRSERVVKISDFGLARVVTAQGDIGEQTVFATPEYASPEQLQGFEIDRRSDLFSLGSVLYAMCTTRPPFEDESTVALIRKVCNDQPRPIQDLNAQTPDSLVKVIDQLLSKYPSLRYPNAVDVERDLAAVASAESAMRRGTR